MKYKVGTRGSALALAQTRSVVNLLKKEYPEDDFEIVKIVTTGDKDQNKPLDSMGTKGVFTDAIEAALCSGEIQFAVHSLKDMPDTLPEGMIFSKPLKRADPRDALILRDAESLSELKKGAVLATGSRRREYQLKQLRPDIQIVPIRGNVDTRIRRIHEGLPDGTRIDGIVIAAAGAERLGREKEITQILHVDEMIPACGQGTLAVELREDSRELLEKLNALSDEETAKAVWLEREFLKRIGADCHALVGACAYRENNEYVLHVIYGGEKCTKVSKAVVRGKDAEESLVEKAVDQIIKDR
ncbi:MAG: hydroxymethylbilane synthase [Eubacterium sp.]|nr:hydroxymethylbilane synthase [Eubacterium sp.]